MAEGVGDLFAYTVEADLDYETGVEDTIPVSVGVDLSPGVEVRGIGDVGVGSLGGSRELETEPYAIGELAILDQYLHGGVKLIDERTIRWGHMNRPYEFTEAELDVLADTGFVYSSADQMLTDEAQKVLGILKARNPNFQYGFRFDFQHIPAEINSYGDPDSPHYPWEAWRFNNFVPSKVLRDVNGEMVRAWPPPPDPVTTWWASCMESVTPGYTFDKQLIDDWIGGLWDIMREYPHWPAFIKWDYFNIPEQGIFTFSGVDEDHNQNGIKYDDDPAEQTAFEDMQLYVSDALRDLLPYPVLITANGSASQPIDGNAALQATFSGPFLEGFPDTPWQSPFEAFDNLWEEKQAALAGNSAYQSYRDQPFVAHTDVRPQTSISSLNASASRAAALIFDIWYRVRSKHDGAETWMERSDDTEWATWTAALGAATGPASRTESVPGSDVTYWRDFEGGRLEVRVTSTNGIMSTGIA